MKDTTMRDALVRLEPFEVRQALHRLVKVALRRKALERIEELPFGAVSLDGKWSAIPSWDHHFAQQKTHDDGLQAYGMVRTISSVLVTSPAKVILDAVPVPAETNEMGIFPHAFDALVRTYGDLFELVMYDAGAASEENMAHVVEAGKHFLFCLADERWGLYQKAKEVLGHLGEDKVRARTEDTLSNSESHVRKLYVAVAPKGYRDWKEVHTLLRVQSQKLKDGVVVAEENRYLVSSKQATDATFDQWLALVRLRWGVENNLHWTLDAIFKEDERPWIRAAPRGTVVVMVLRRIAYDLLALFRSVTQRSAENRQLPWRELLAWVYDTLIAATDAHLQGLREREANVVFS
jgi:predicted transposase YbfD/YdcC